MFYLDSCLFWFLVKHWVSIISGVHHQKAAIVFALLVGCLRKNAFNAFLKNKLDVIIEEPQDVFFVLI